MSQTNDPIRRAALPEILFAEDVGVALDLPEERASSLVRQNRLGRFFLVGGRPALLRDEFLDALAALGDAPMDDREVLP